MSQDRSFPPGTLVQFKRGRRIVCKKGCLDRIDASIERPDFVIIVNGKVVLHPQRGVVELYYYYNDQVYDSPTDFEVLAQGSLK